MTGRSDAGLYLRETARRRREGCDSREACWGKVPWRELAPGEAGGDMVHDEDGLGEEAI